MRIVGLLLVVLCFATSFASENAARAIDDTMITGDFERIYRFIPDYANPRDELARVRAGSIVYVIDKVPVPHKLGGKDVEYFLKVRTTDGVEGYIWRNVLISKKLSLQHQDSLKIWAQISQPTYKNLIGTTYFKNDELPTELFSGEFVSIGKKNLYGVISVDNKYNGNYSYLFFVIEDKTKGDGLKILDIVPLDAAFFKNRASLWFKQCECQNKSGDCSDVVAIYRHNEKMAKKNIMVKPDIAWQPNYVAGKLETIPPETVKCGSIAPDEDDNVGP